MPQELCDNFRRNSVYHMTYICPAQKPDLWTPDFLKE